MAEQDEARRREQERQQQEERERERDRYGKRTDNGGNGKAPTAMSAGPMDEAANVHHHRE